MQGCPVDGEVLLSFIVSHILHGKAAFGGEGDVKFK